jgi:putative spermidine/putrescine transport system permease protein
MKLPNMLPKTFKAMESWDGQELPSEEVFKAFYLDFRNCLVEERREGKLSTQMNYHKKWI